VPPTRRLHFLFETVAVLSDRYLAERGEIRKLVRSIRFVAQRVRASKHPTVIYPLSKLRLEIATEVGNQRGKFQNGLQERLDLDI
jgi:hypothetical protein